MQGAVLSGSASGGRNALPVPNTERKRIKCGDDGSSSAFNVNLNNGNRNSNTVSNSNNKRALCVRRRS